MSVVWRSDPLPAKAGPPFQGGDTGFVLPATAVTKRNGPSPREKGRGPAAWLVDKVCIPTVRLFTTIPVDGFLHRSYDSPPISCFADPGWVQPPATIRKDRRPEVCGLWIFFNDGRFSSPYCQPIIRATAAVTIWVRSSNRNRGTNHFHHFSTLTPAIPAHTGAMAVGHRMLDSPSPYWKHSTAS